MLFCAGWPLQGLKLASSVHILYMRVALVGAEHSLIPHRWP
jgi:hypothetical protein